MNAPRYFIAFAAVLILLGGISFLLSLPQNRVQAQSTLFQDSFDSGIDSSEWQPFLNSSRLSPEQWYAQGNKLHFNPDRGGTEAHDGLFMHNNEYWTDYTFEADISGINAGMWFRGTYEQSSYPNQKITGYYLVLRASEAILWKIQTETNCTTACGKPQNLYSFNNPTEITKVGLSNNGTQTFHVKITLSGASIKINVNGSNIIQASDSDFPSGTVGFKTYKNVATFDNVVVSGTSGTDPTPPVCGKQFNKPFKSFEGIRMYMTGSGVTDPESGIKSGVWEVKSGSTSVKKMNTLTGYLTDIPSGKYEITLTLTNGSNGTKTCSQDLLVYSPDGFKGTVKLEEVDDYVIPSYNGPLYADNNPKRAVIASWPGSNARFIFWHESAYEPHWEFPNGAGMKYQFFEGAHGSGELLNKYGRMDKNSYPEIIQDDPKLGIVKWWYYDVNMDTGERAAYAEEYFYFFPNGLILREQELQWGNSFEPMEFIMINPAKKPWWTTVTKEGDNYHMSTAMDIYKGLNREHWATPGGGLNDANCWASGASEAQMEAATGMLFRSHYKDYVDPFIMYGNNSFVVNDDIKELCSWKYPHFVHGNIGWINSEWKKATQEELDTYPTCTPLLGTNHDGKGPYYWLIGARDATNSVLADIGKEWLEYPYFVPCSDAECDLEEPTGPSNPPDPPVDGEWKYDAGKQVCEETASGSGITCETTHLSLDQGWNIFALPSNLNSSTTSTWLHTQPKEFGKSIPKISIWTANNRFEGTTEEQGEIYGNEVDLDPSYAIFAFVPNDTDIAEFPYPPTSSANTTINWREGFNGVTLRSKHVGKGEKSNDFLKKTLPTLTPTVTFKKAHISYFATDKQRWITQIFDGGNFYGDTFDVLPDHAYFIYMEK